MDVYLADGLLEGFLVALHLIEELLVLHLVLLHLIRVLLGLLVHFGLVIRAQVLEAGVEFSFHLAFAALEHLQLLVEFAFLEADAFLDLLDVRGGTLELTPDLLLLSVLLDEDLLAKEVHVLAEFVSLDLGEKEIFGMSDGGQLFAVLSQLGFFVLDIKDAEGAIAAH
jgi:hypothetical protein